MDINDIINGFRKALQEVLVPELKTVQMELKHLNQRMDAMDKRFDAMQQQMDKRFDAVHQEIKEMQKEMNTMNIIQQKILDKIDVDKRIIRLETLVEQLIRKAA